MGNYLKDISGVKKGKLTAISFNKIENNSTYWNYKCDCGNIVLKKASEVNRGKVKSCGCLNKEWLKKLSKIQTLENNESCKNRIYRNYKRGAIDRKIKFNLTKEDFFKFLDKPCYYCGDEFTNEIKQGKFGVLKYNGIDRCINTEGYNIENCVSCCYKCNKMKMNLNDDDFLNQINKIYSYKL